LVLSPLPLDIAGADLLEGRANANTLSVAGIEFVGLAVGAVTAVGFCLPLVGFVVIFLGAIAVGVIALVLVADDRL
jgi:hypothetical protein